jgi:hypothetical protein
VRAAQARVGEGKATEGWGRVDWVGGGRLPLLAG